MSKLNVELYNTKLIIYTFLVSRIALFMGLSITILMMFTLDSFLQLWLVDKANSLFKIKKNINDNIERKIYT